MSTTFSSRFQRLKDLLNTLSQMPDHELTLTPLDSSQTAPLTNGLPPGHLRILTEIGEICLSHRDYLVIESYLPCPLAASPFYSFESDSFKDFEHFLIYAHDVDGRCYGYDTRTQPFDSYEWDFHGCEPSPMQDLDAFSVMEEAIVSHLSWLGLSR